MTSDIDRAIVFCNRLDPLFGPRLKGVSDDRLERLEKHVTLHPIHREYLSRIGIEGPGPYYESVDLSPEAILKAHEETQGKLPEGVTLFGLALDDPWFDFVLFEGIGLEPSVRIVNSCVGGNFNNLDMRCNQYIADTLPQFLCLSVLVSPVGRNVFPHRRQGGQNFVDETALYTFELLCLREGFVPIWPSQVATRILYRDTMMIVGRQSLREAFAVYIHGNKRDEVEDMARKMESELKVMLATFEESL